MIKRLVYIQNYDEISKGDIYVPLDGPLTIVAWADECLKRVIWKA